MKITVTGSLRNISRRLVEKLVSEKHQVTVVSHTPERTAAIEALGAKPAIGSVEDLNFLQQTFEGADAVYTMVPPNFSVPDYSKFTIRVCENYATAIEKAAVRHVVNLSSAGSALAGTAPLTGYQNLEERLNTLAPVNVLHLRPGGFYSNFYGSIGMIKQYGIIGNNFDETTNMVLSHPHDITDAAFEALRTCSFNGITIQYILSDEKNGKDVARILGEAIGKHDLRWVQFSDDQLLDALIQNGFSPDAAQHYIVDMGTAIREGLLEKHYKQNKHPVYGRLRFEQFAKEFTAVYSAG